MHELTHQELDRIRIELAHIARLIGPGSSYRMLLEDTDAGVAVDLPLGDVLRLVPVGWVRALPGDAESVLPVTVLIEHLFEQVERNRITVPLSALTTNIPPEYVDFIPVEMAAELVELPFELILDSLVGHLLQD